MNDGSALDLTGKRAIVTGAASGIGTAVARRLASAGARVVLADVDGPGARAVAGEVGGEVWQVDLSDTRGLEDLVLDADILVNNAGVQHVAAIEEFPADRFRLILQLMVEAPFLLTRAALPSMHERGWGRLIHVSSVHGLRASAFKAAYVTAKHAIEGFSKVAALEGAEHGITSNCVNPGYVRTPLVERQIGDQARIHRMSEADVVGDVLLERSAIKRLIEPAEVAEAVAYLCGPWAAFMTGTNLVLDGGWTAH